MTDLPYSYDAVVPPDVGVERVRQALQARNAKKVADIPRGEKQLAEEVWQYEDGDRIRIVDDHFVDIRSLRAESATALKPGDMLYDLRSELRLQEIDDLIDVGRSDSKAQRSHAIRGLSAIMRRYRSDVTDLIASGLTDSDAALRDDALRAIARWPHFAYVAKLEAMARKESDADLREEAIRLADDVRKFGRRGT